MIEVYAHDTFDLNYAKARTEEDSLTASSYKEAGYNYSKSWNNFRILLPGLIIIQLVQLMGYATHSRASRFRRKELMQDESYRGQNQRFW